MWSRILIFIAALIYSVQANCQNVKPRQLKTYTVNLDLDPYLRFQEISHDYKDAMIELVNAQKFLLFYFLLKNISIFNFDYFFKEKLLIQLQFQL